jgi:hypothetical protein
MGIISDIQAAIITRLRLSPEGIKRSVLLKHLKAELGAADGSIDGALRGMELANPPIVERIPNSHGMWRLCSPDDDRTVNVSAAVEPADLQDSDPLNRKASSSKLAKGGMSQNKQNYENKSLGKKEVEQHEKPFYESFVKWFLSKETWKGTRKAFAYGGSQGGEKWANPDVVGIIRPAPRFQAFQPEVVFVEIKWEDSQAAVLTGFAQAIAYGQYCNRSYLAIPISVQENVKKRIRDLCDLEGIGLILFDREHPEDSNWNPDREAKLFSPGIEFISSKLIELGEEALGALGF